MFFIYVATEEIICTIIIYYFTICTITVSTHMYAVRVYIDIIDTYFSHSLDTGENCIKLHNEE